MALSPAASTIGIGSVIAETYRIEAPLGRGGMGMVFLASHNRLPGKRVAIKVLHAELANEEMLARFKREAEIVSLLSHPNIVHVEDFNVTPDGTPYLVLEYLQGESLAQRLARGPVTLELTLSIVRQVGAAVAAAHAKGIVHRDLKPQNIFLVPTEIDGRPAETAKVLDFGISKMLGSQGVKTEESSLLGTPQYMAPEQATGNHATIDARTDVFALGAIVHEMLSGHPAFVGESVPEIVYKIVHEAPQPLPAHVPEPIASAIRHAMAKSAADRFPSVSGFIEAITGRRLSVPTSEHAPTSHGDDGSLAQTVASENQQRGVISATPRRTIPHRWIVAGASGLVAIAAVVAYVALHRTAPERLNGDRMRSVAAQLMTENEVELDGQRYPVGETARDHLKIVKFELRGHPYEAIQQNPGKDSRWAELARQGHRVVQFKDRETNSYVGVVVDGEALKRVEP